MPLSSITSSWKSASDDETELLGEAQDQLNDKSDFSWELHNPLATAPVQEMPSHPVLAPACRIGSMNTCLSEGSRGFFFPGCMLKAALPSAQPVLHPQQLNPPTQCPNSVGSSTKVCMGTQICRIKAFIHATNTHQGASMFIKHLKFPRQLTDYICKDYRQSGQSLGKHFL